MILLDTHTFLWFILDDAQLSSKADALISDPSNEISISPVTYWEIAIKISIGKYSLPEPYQVFMDREIGINNFRILAIQPKHTATLIDLPLYHKDPFDRLLISQAIVENMPILSADKAFDAYPIHRIW
jgi:PIN domain nuclease of toxin-antitoxin system